MRDDGFNFQPPGVRCVATPRLASRAATRAHARARTERASSSPVASRARRRDVVERRRASPRHIRDR